MKNQIIIKRKGLRICVGDEDPQTGTVTPRIYADTNSHTLQCTNLIHFSRKHSCWAVDFVVYSKLEKTNYRVSLELYDSSDAPHVYSNLYINEWDRGADILVQKDGEPSEVMVETKGGPLLIGRYAPAGDGRSYFQPAIASFKEPFQGARLTSMGIDDAQRVFTFDYVGIGGEKSAQTLIMDSNNTITSIMDGLGSSIDPFYMCYHKDCAAMCLSCTIDSKFQEGLHFDGYSWEQAAEVFVDENMPHLREHVRFTSENGMFCAEWTSMEALEEFATAFRPFCDYTNRVMDAFQRFSHEQTNLKNTVLYHIPRQKTSLNKLWLRAALEMARQKNIDYFEITDTLDREFNFIDSNYTEGMAQRVYDAIDTGPIESPMWTAMCLQAGIKPADIPGIPAPRLSIERYGRRVSAMGMHTVIQDGITKHRITREYDGGPPAEHIQGLSKGQAVFITEQQAEILHRNVADDSAAIAYHLTDDLDSGTSTCVKSAYWEQRLEEQQESFFWKYL